MTEIKREQRTVSDKFFNLSETDFIEKRVALEWLAILRHAAHATSFQKEAHGAVAWGDESPLYKEGGTARIAVTDDC